MTPRRSPLPTTRGAHRDGGYTMTEIIVTIGIVGVLMAVAVGGWTRWSGAADQEGTATTIQAVLRDAQQRAVTEGTSVCVAFDVDGDEQGWTVSRGACGATYDQVGRDDVDGGGTALDSASFSSGAGSPTTGVTFFPRGTATPGSVKVVRRGSDTVWTVSVEGLTGRVSVS